MKTYTCLAREDTEALKFFFKSLDELDNHTGIAFILLLTDSLLRK